MSIVLRTIIHTLARLRLACEAMGIDPRDVRLEDLAGDQSARLIRAANQDLQEIINADSNPTDAAESADKHPRPAGGVYRRSA